MNATVPTGEQIWRLLTPPPGERGLILGSTGSGKSTLAGALLDDYHAEHPTHRIFIIDPKRRFLARRGKEGERLLPDGYDERPRGRRRAVLVNARMLAEMDGFNFKDSAFLLQSMLKATEFFEWVYDAGADIRRPILIYVDEVQDFLNGIGRPQRSLLRLLKQGRGLAVGLLAVSQSMHYVDRTFMSEFERVYVGQLLYKDDRLKLARNISLASADRFVEPVERYTFALVDQVRRQYLPFRLEL